MTLPVGTTGGVAPETPPPGSALDESLENAIELKEVEGLSQGQIVRRRFFRHKGALIGLLTIAAVTLLAFSSVGVWFIPGWWKHDHTTLYDLTNNSRPTLNIPLINDGGFRIGEHPFGQDQVGRDIFARTMKGVQTSIFVMVTLSFVAAVLGITVGAIAGYFRGTVDQILMRITDLFLTFPVIVTGAVLGKLVSGGGRPLGLSLTFWLAIALGCLYWTTLARLVRGEFLTLREREFVDAAKVAGASSFRIIRKHMLPNAMGVIIVNTTLLMSAAVLLETALGYLGFGIKDPAVSLGTMISDYESAFNTRPWLFWWPGVFIIILALAVNFVGDGLRDAFDPRQKRIPSARKMAKAGEAQK